MQNIAKNQLEIPLVKGQPFDSIPDDLFIPPNALELVLESFSGPMDLLLYLIKKENIDILCLQELVPYTDNEEIIKTFKNINFETFLNMLNKLGYQDYLICNAMNDKKEIIGNSCYYFLLLCCN